MGKTVKYFIILFLVITNQASAQNVTSIKVLFVGNSFTSRNNIPKLVSEISELYNVHIEATMSAAEGATLDDHWNQRKGLQTKSLIAQEKYDFVILQDQSTRPINYPNETLKSINLFCKYTRIYNSRIGLFLTWSVKDASNNSQEQINKTYLKAANENNALLIPIGKIWQITKEKFSDVELYDNDKIHSSYLGAYLSSIIIVSFLDENMNLNDIQKLMDGNLKLKKDEKKFIFDLFKTQTRN